MRAPFAPNPANYIFCPVCNEALFCGPGRIAMESVQAQHIAEGC